MIIVQQNQSTASTPKVAKKALVNRSLSVTKGKGVNSARKKHGTADNDENGSKVMKFLKSQRIQDKKVVTRNSEVTTGHWRRRQSKMQLRGKIGGYWDEAGNHEPAHGPIQEVHDVETSRQMMLYLFPEMRQYDRT